jgi:hypothetical protein
VRLWAGEPKRKGQYRRQRLVCRGGIRPVSKAARVEQERGIDRKSEPILETPWKQVPDHRGSERVTASDPIERNETQPGQRRAFFLGCGGLATYRVSPSQSHCAATNDIGYFAIYRAFCPALMASTQRLFIYATSGEGVDRPHPPASARTVVTLLRSWPATTGNDNNRKPPLGIQTSVTVFGVVHAFRKRSECLSAIR